MIKKNYDINQTLLGHIKRAASDRMTGQKVDEVN